MHHGLPCRWKSECAQNLSHEVCGVITSVKQCTLCASSMHDVHHSIVEINVVIGVLVHCELLVVRVVPIIFCNDAVVRRTLVLIAFTVAFVFVVAISHRILLYWRYIVYTFGTQGYACSQGQFIAYLHFIPRYPHGLPWHVSKENTSISS